MSDFNGKWNAAREYSRIIQDLIQPFIGMTLVLVTILLIKESNKTHFIQLNKHQGLKLNKICIMTKM